MTTRQLPQHWAARLLCGLAVLLSVAVVSADECGQPRLRAKIHASETLTQTTTSQVFMVTLSGTGEGSISAAWPSTRPSASTFASSGTRRFRTPAPW